MLNYSGKKSGLSMAVPIHFEGPSDENPAVAADRKAKSDRSATIALQIAQEVLKDTPDDHNVRVNSVWNEHGFHLSIQ